MMTINKNTDPDQYYNRKTTPSNSLPDGPGFKIFISIILLIFQQAIKSLLYFYVILNRNI